MPARKETVKKVRKLLTTGDIADLTGFTARAVANWIDEGKLIGVDTPGTSRERRVYRQDFRDFAERMKYHWVLRELDEEEGIAPPKPEGPEPVEIPPRPARKKK